MPIQLNLCWVFFFFNIFMCSEYFGNFLAKKQNKQKNPKKASWSYLSVQIVRLMHKGYVGNFLMFWHWFVF